MFVIGQCKFNQLIYKQTKKQRICECTYHFCDHYEFWPEVGAGRVKLQQADPDEDAVYRIETLSDDKHVRKAPQDHPGKRTDQDQEIYPIEEGEFPPIGYAVLQID